jgi:DNA-binding PadR family transcriptional regulator
VAARGKSRVAVWRDAVRDSQLDRTSKAVAWCLSTYMDRHGHARPSRQTLAAGSSLSDRAVDTALQRLEAAGYLAVARTRGGNNRTNAYVSLLPSTANEVRRSEWANSERDALNGERHAPNGEGASHESGESAESGGAVSPGGDSTRLVEDDCMLCGERRPLHDFL